MYTNLCSIFKALPSPLFDARDVSIYVDQSRPFLLLSGYNYSYSFMLINFAQSGETPQQKEILSSASQPVNHSIRLKVSLDFSFQVGDHCQEGIWGERA